MQAVAEELVFVITDIPVMVERVEKIFQVGHVIVSFDNFLVRIHCKQVC